jgi:hypothetical protein
VLAGEAAETCSRADDDDEEEEEAPFPSRDCCCRARDCCG